jgi:ABC-type molybdate transport system substrate-binding protein
LKHRVIASLLALLVLGSASACGDDHKKGADQTTTSGASTTTAATSATGPGATVGPNTIAIFAPAALGDVLQQLTATYKDAHPEVTFQVTTGNTDDLINQVNQHAKPNLYIDAAQVLGRLSKSVVKGAPVTFGSDAVVAITPAGNPKHFTDLKVFGGDPSTTSGMCDAKLACGVYGRQLMQEAKIAPIPDIVDSSETSLVERVAGRQIDAALVTRSASRKRFGKLGGIPLYYGPNVKIDYQAATIQQSAAAADFLRFATQFQAGKRILAIRGFLPLAVLKAG